MKAKKTIEVAILAERLQAAISMNTRTDQERQALVWALEYVLGSTGNYRGFQFDCGDDQTNAGEANYYKRTYYLPK